jgi:demethoxyubiquinone hydroxylase (CLK1/Coq7/Cat5 family)
MNEYAPWFAIAVAAASLIYTIVTSRSKKHGEDIAAIKRSIGVVESQVMEVKQSADQRVDKVEDRVTRVEAEMEHLPDKDVTHRLEIALTKMNGEMAAMKESIKPISAMAARIQEAIIEKVSS